MSDYFVGRNMANLLKVLKSIPRLFLIVKRPIYVTLCYIFRTTPGHIDLRGGGRIYFSSHSHDIVTFFVVFCKKDYGNVDKHSVVVDIGANIGIFSLYAALNGAKRVYCYEPSVESFETLKKNIAENKLSKIVIARNMAVTKNDKMEICFTRSSSPYNQININSEIGDPDKDDVIIKTISLSAIVNLVYNDTKENINLLKMDCEGAEFEIILSTNAKSFSKISSIRMECHGDPDIIINNLMAKNFDLERSVNNDLWFNYKSK
jgi:FkbM family methyltransferase